MLGGQHISFATAKIGSLLDVQASAARHRPIDGPPLPTSNLFPSASWPLVAAYVAPNWKMAPSHLPPPPSLL